MRSLRIGHAGSAGQSPARGFPRSRQCQYHEERASSSARPMARIDMSDNGNGRRGGEGPGARVIVKAKAQTQKPSMYKGLMLNQHDTPRQVGVATPRRRFQQSA